MAQGEGVGVHDERGGNAVGFRLFQRFQVVGEAAFPVLHEHQRAVHPGDLIKAQTAEKFGGFHLRVQEQMQISPGLLHLHQVGNDFVEQSLALMLPAHGEAP